ncbi:MULTISPECIES: hypothetical protein [unclassified Sporosarcina]|uniref:hypothetical protein n=1 Tax=unclassified Sporosarcina TaxID=2647733 RepID=UPI0020400D14|nr:MULTISPECIES: hypothetical protein [unclassified Sporosarcina]GKV65545.1 hypothetical protein NCCP2331_16980 [Sporosarcina sp. NCCP-2331]GLB55670.1 hypothetical protein NCCP2378_14570 [Sporosarcina sp. NCCP-2378]
MKIKGSFSMTSFKLDKSTSQEVLKTLEKYREVEDEDVIYNQKDLLFLEEKYMENCKSFSRILDKFKIKKFDDKLCIYRENEINKLEDYSQEARIFKLVISENNINNISKDDLNMSIKHFMEYEMSKRISFIQYIYILLFLSNSTDYDENHFMFKVNIEDKEIKKEVSFFDDDFCDLENIYLWITKSKENLHTRLNIIRKLIATKNTFHLDEKDLNSAKSCFNRIINDETEKYFEHVNMLKEDFLRLNNQRQKAYQSLHLKFLGWGASIALFLYEEVKNIRSEDVWNSLLFSSNEKVSLFLIIFISSLIIIWLIFNKEIKENHKEFLEIKQFYLTELFFDESDDKTQKLDVPKISNIYSIIFFTIIVILSIRLVTTFHY